MLWSASPLPSTLVGADQVIRSPQEAADLGLWADLAARGIFELLSDIPESEAPLGYAAPVLEEDSEGRTVAVQDARGTAADRAIATAIPVWEATAAAMQSQEIEAARAVLANTGSTTDQKLAAVRVITREQNG